jgi:hypothetical protein
MNAYSLARMLHGLNGLREDIVVVKDGKQDCRQRDGKAALVGGL